MSATDGLTKARTRLANVQAEKQEFKLSILRGEYIKVKDHERAMEKLIGSVKAKLLAMPTKYAPQLGGQSARMCEQVLSIAVNELLLELSDE